MTGRLIKKRWIVAGVFLATAMASLMAIWPEAKEIYAMVKQKREMRNLETEVVRIELLGQHFDVPMRYMYGEAIEKYHQWPTAKPGRTTVAYLHLSVLLPDMRPYYPEEDARWKVRGYGDKVQVTIKRDEDSADWCEYHRQRINDRIKQGTATKQTTVYDLLHFSTPLGPEYFPVDETNELSINCSRPEPGMLPSCSVKSNYRPGITLEYYYGLAYLPRWREIDDGLKAMFDQFAHVAQAAHPEPSTKEK